MNNEVEFDIFTFDYQEDDEKNNLLSNICILETLCHVCQIMILVLVKKI